MSKVAYKFYWGRCKKRPRGSGILAGSRSMTYSLTPTRLFVGDGLFSCQWSDTISIKRYMSAEGKGRVGIARAILAYALKVFPDRKNL
jgi:hypothetical protein